MRHTPSAPHRVCHTPFMESLLQANRDRHPWVPVVVDPVLIYTDPLKYIAMFLSGLAFLVALDAALYATLVTMVDLFLVRGAP